MKNLKFINLVTIVMVSLLLMSCDNGVSTVSNEAVEERQIDVDLQGLSGTMIFSQIYDMLYYPENYEGKTVRMEGLFDAYIDGETGEYNYACVVPDATACCQEGFSLVIDKEAVFPDDFPELGEEITVIGTYETTFDGMFTYVYLRLDSAEDIVVKE